MSNEVSQSFFEYLGLKNEPRTDEQIAGKLDEMIEDQESTDKDIIWFMKLIDKRVDDKDN